MGGFKKRCLIAYFSREGNNYVAGKIVDLPVGNTKISAEKIYEIVGGGLFRIESAIPYPADYNEVARVAENELRADARPKLSADLDGISSYDVIFLGYPNWCGTMPTPVFTFLEGYDFSGKVVVPFCTHEGSGFGRSEKDIEKLCPGAKLLKGLAIRGSRVNDAGKDIAAWLDNVNASLSQKQHLVVLARVLRACMLMHEIYWPSATISISLSI